MSRPRIEYRWPGQPYLVWGDKSWYLDSYCYDVSPAGLERLLGVGIAAAEAGEDVLLAIDRSRGALR